MGRFDENCYKKAAPHSRMWYHQGRLRGDLAFGYLVSIIYITRNLRSHRQYFFIDFQKSEKSTQIFSLQYLYYYSKIKVEKLRQQNEIPQCKRCQSCGLSKDVLNSPAAIIPSEFTKKRWNHLINNSFFAQNSLEVYTLFQTDVIINLPQSTIIYYTIIYIQQLLIKI